MPKILIIHPRDISTDFLCACYDGLDCEIVNTNVSKSQLRCKIKESDKVIFLGHGSKLGLFGFNRMVIDSTFVYLLRAKEIVAIWCDANLFAQKYGLDGYFSGMIISDLNEANYFNVKTSLNEIGYSNLILAQSIKSFLLSDKTPIKHNYSVLNSELFSFNKNNL